MYSRQGGNFLLQALLALTLVFMFVPFIAKNLVERNLNAQMYATTKQIEVAQTAARIYVHENASKLNYGTVVVRGNGFSDLLEPYGLPLGFVPKTALGQDIVLVLDKTENQINAYLKIIGGNLTQLKIAELARRIGFYAMPDGDALSVGLALESGYIDVVSRNGVDEINNAFLTDLDMGGFAVNNVGNVFGQDGEFETAEFGMLNISGIENGRRSKNVIKMVTADKTIFQTNDGTAALSLLRGNIVAENVTARTVSRFGEGGTFNANDAALNEFAMTAGYTNFVGPIDWKVHGNVVTSRINLSVNQLDIESYLDAARGQDVYINTDDLEYSASSGIDVDYVNASNITLRNQTSRALSMGRTGGVLLDIRPAGTSVLPDISVDTVDNAGFAILANAQADNSKTVDCKSIISGLGGVYNAKSVVQNMICQYVFWQRLEHRINIKQCLLDGKSGCN